MMPAVVWLKKAGGCSTPSIGVSSDASRMSVVDRVRLQAHFNFGLKHRSQSCSNPDSWFSAVPVEAGPATVGPSLLLVGLLRDVRLISASSISAVSAMAHYGLRTAEGHKEAAYLRPPEL